MLSSPGAVQAKSMEEVVGLDAVKLLIAAGAVVSAAAEVAKLGTLESAEVLGASSEVFMAK